MRSVIFQLIIYFFIGPGLDICYNRINKYMNGNKKDSSYYKVRQHFITAIPNSRLGITPTEIFIYTYHYK